MAELSIAEQWVHVSIWFGWASERTEFTLVIQQLGRLDLRFCEEERRIATLTDIQRAHESEMMAFEHLMVSSWLWVLGCYEMVRSLHQFMRDLPTPPHGLVEVGEFKQELAQIRIPLAK